MTDLTWPAVAQVALCFVFALGAVLTAATGTRWWARRDDQARRRAAGVLGRER